MFSPRLAPTVDAALAVGSTLRFDADQYSWRSQSSQFLRGRQMMIGSNFFHLGVLVLIVGGIAALISATLLLHRRLADPRIRRSSPLATSRSSR